MAEETFPLIPKASISLALMTHQPLAPRARPAALRATGRTSDGGALESARVQRGTAIVEARNAGQIADKVAGVDVTQLSEGVLAVDGPVDQIAALAELSEVKRVQTKKMSQPNLDAVLPAIGLSAPGAGARRVDEDGTGVLIGIVDSGFDLSHPMFRDGNGRLRVDGLLDQSGASPRSFTTAQLEQQWSNGRGPGADDNGHGTHVATIAAGSTFEGLEGVAPGARFLLVKTNFLDTPDAVSWLFGQAGNKPCVVNMSLGHHWGSHDGTDVEERLHTQLTGRGKIIVISAGNERADDIHIGGRFHQGQTHDVLFDLVPQGAGPSFVVINLFYERADRFAASLITPAGDVVTAPQIGRVTRSTFGAISVEIGTQRYTPTNAVQVQIGVQVPVAANNTSLRGWGVRLTCQRATVGRIDGWFHNSGFARFRQHALLENARTVGLSATGLGCLTVASHVSKSEWLSDDGEFRNNRLVVGRTSPFSSLGPTRLGGQKPDVSAPGQMVTAALAAGSDSANDERSALTTKRLLTIAGTSMSAPVVTGAVALLLQQKPQRNLDDIRSILARTSTRDAHTGAAPWDPVYGVGKLDIAAALGSG